MTFHAIYTSSGHGSPNPCLLPAVGSIDHGGGDVFFLISLPVFRVIVHDHFIAT